MDEAQPRTRTAGDPAPGDGPGRSVSDARRWAGIARALADRWSAAGYRSFDPYDGLAAPWIRPELLPRAIRLGLVQLHKRSPVNLRPLFGIPATRNAYAMGLFASTRLTLWRQTGDDADLAAAREDLDRLREDRIRGGWAYPFDVQTKTHFYPATVPNVVSTAFAAEAYLDAPRASEPGALTVALEAAAFATRELLVPGDRPFFAYVPGERDLIHNANLLAARLCVRAGTLGGDETLIDAGTRAIVTTLAAQRPDGSFSYGAGPRFGWVDGHHTGFVVECLSDLAPHAPAIEEPLARAAGFYRERLFEPDGAPRPAPDRRFPADVIAGAQGILTFAKLGDLAFAERIGTWVLANLRAPHGGFVYQRGRVVRRSVPYARWCDAPMALALATLAERSRGA